MKKIDRLLLTSFIGPFVVSFGIALFVLIMQFLWLYIDEIAGKGVSIFVMIELIAYMSISTFPMALPIAVLIASVMVMGNLAERYELSSMKSAGISLLRVMRSLAFCAMGVALFSYICSDFLIPISNLKFKSRLFDIRRQKPALTLEKGVFNEDFRQFVIRISDKEKDGETIDDVMIEDQTNTGRTKFNKILADSGQMYTTDDRRYFVMNLFNGTIYQEPGSQGQPQKQKYPFIRTNFRSWTKVWDMKEFEMTASDPNRFKEQRSMLSMSQLQANMDSLQRTMESNRKAIGEDLLLTVKRITGKLENKPMQPPPTVTIPKDTVAKPVSGLQLRVAPANKEKLATVDTNALKIAARIKRQQATTENVPSGNRFDDFNASGDDTELRKKVAELTEKSRKKKPGETSSSGSRNTCPFRQKNDRAQRKQGRPAHCKSDRTSERSISGKSGDPCDCLHCRKTENIPAGTNQTPRSVCFLYRNLCYGGPRPFDERSAPESGPGKEYRQ